MPHKDTYTSVERQMHRLRMIPARMEAERLIAEKLGIEPPSDVPAPRSWAADAVEEMNREIERLEDGGPSLMDRLRRLFRR